MDMDFPHPTFNDWVGLAPASPQEYETAAFDTSVTSFERYVDDEVVRLTNAQLNADIDWSMVFNPTIPTAPSLAAYSHSGDSISSMATLVNSCAPTSPFKFLDGLYPSPSPLDGYQFSFQFDPTNTVPEQLPSPAGSDEGHEQPQFHHEVGVAESDAAHVSLLVVEASENAIIIPLTSTTPVVGPDHESSPAPTTKRGTRKRKQPSPDRTVVKKRRQDTTPKHACDHCGAMFARSYNLRVHVSSVHKGERNFRCSDDGCTKVFARKHDLTRHFQSKHTDLGSPRRKGGKVANH